MLMNAIHREREREVREVRDEGEREEWKREWSREGGREGEREKGGRREVRKQRC